MHKKITPWRNNVQVGHILYLIWHSNPFFVLLDFNSEGCDNYFISIKHLLFLIHCLEDEINCYINSCLRDLSTTTININGRGISNWHFSRDQRFSIQPERNLIKAFEKIIDESKKWMFKGMNDDIGRIGFEILCSLKRDYSVSQRHMFNVYI